MSTKSRILAALSDLSTGVLAVGGVMAMMGAVADGDGTPIQWAMVAFLAAVCAIAWDILQVLERRERADAARRPPAPRRPW